MVRDPETISTELYYKDPKYRREAYSAWCSLGCVAPRLPQRTPSPELALQGKCPSQIEEARARDVNGSDEVIDKDEDEGEDGVGTE